MEICKRLAVDPNGVITRYLQELELSGFIQRDYVYSLGSGKRSKLSRYRLKDNYLRFYLKYIEPVREKIAAGIQEAQTFGAFDTIMGLQFQNLVLNNLPLVLEKLKIPLAEVKSASPYFQNKTRRQEACQVDLLIDTQYAVYVCEIKFQSYLSVSVVDEVMEKIRKLKIAKGKSIRPVLIYSGDIPQNISESASFDELVSFEQFLK